MTPSGFYIGIILKTKVSRKYFAFSSSLIKKSMTPFIMNEALDSPGCTLDVSIAAFLTAISWGSEVKFVTISMSTSLPASDLHKTVLRILSLFWKLHHFLTSSTRSV